MIILTPEQAEAVRGESSPGAMLDPVPLADGSFVLPEAVLGDTAHAARFALLVTLPRRPVHPSEFPAPAEE